MYPRLLPAAVLVCLVQSALPAEPTYQAEADKFTRFEEDTKGARLQTGVASYVNKDGVQVDLIGAIHIGDKAYYDKLNERFTRYEVLLYEMVGNSIEKRANKIRAAAEGREPDETKEDREETAASKNLSWLHPLYDTMEKSLALSSQIRCIDYHSPNFVHADMTARQFADMQKAKSESFLSLWWKSVVVQWQHPEAVPETPGLLKIMEILCRKDSATELKRLVARVFGSMEGVLSGLETEGGTVILTERNRVALDVMQQQIKLGKKNLGIFYGAAHLQDMEKRLLAMGFKRTGGEWLTAWDLPPEPKEDSK